MGEKPRNPKDERREDQRIDRSFILSYFCLETPEEKFEITQVKNISLGGMCFVTTQHFEPSIKLGLELKTPYLSGTTYVEGVVLESHEKMKDKIYETRLQFGKLDAEAKILLEKLIEFFVD